MNDTTVSDPNRDDDERERERASPAERHQDAVDATSDATERVSTATDGGPNAGHATSEQPESGNGDQASFELGIGKVDGPINFHNIYLRIRGQSLLHVLLALLLTLGLFVVGYWALIGL